MKLFHISDVLSVTTGYLVSNRHMDGVYDILNFLTKDELFTHQLPRASDECQPWLRAMFPTIMKDSPGMPERLTQLSIAIKDTATKQQNKEVVDKWVEDLRVAFSLPEMLPVYEMGEHMHTYIDPIQEAQAMLGDDKVLIIEIPNKE